MGYGGDFLLTTMAVHFWRIQDVKMEGLYKVIGFLLLDNHTIMIIQIGRLINSRKQVGKT